MLLQRTDRHPNLPSQSLGFTLIEMLVTITVAMLVIGGGLVAYLSFNERQNIIAASNQLQLVLRTAQTKARIGDRPSSCDHLQSYSVLIRAGSNQLKTLANCANGSHDVKTDDMPISVTARTSVTPEFLVLTGGVSGAGKITLQAEVMGTLTLYELEVTQGGELINTGFIVGKSGESK